MQTGRGPQSQARGIDGQGGNIHAGVWGTLRRLVSLVSESSALRGDALGNAQLAGCSEFLAD